MKWAILLAFIMLVPLLAAMLRGNPRNLLHVGVAIGLLPFMIAPLHLYVAPISWPMWLGAVKGVEVTLLDAVALAVVLATRPARIPAVIVAAFAAFLLAVCLATLLAGLKVPATFYVWQVMRTALVSVAVARATSAVSGVPLRILIGGGIGLFIELCSAASQFASGQAQAGGLMGHQNSLGLASHFVVYPAVALLLSGRQMFLAVVIVVTEVAIVLLGGSRATIGLFAGGLLITVSLSCWQQITGRKIAIAAAAVIGLAVSTPAMIWAIDRRSESARQSSNEERSQMQLAARLMIADHPLGVGPNQYLLQANVGGYSARAEVPWTDRAAPVHNLYLLMGAESGVLGVLTLIGFLLSVIAVGLRSIKRLRRVKGTILSDLLVGSVASMIIGSIHFAFEWIAIQFPFHYLAAVVIGVILGIRSLLKLDTKQAGQRAARRSRRAMQPA